jgi:hypothetical protein
MDTQSARVLAEHDVSDLIGLNVLVKNAAIVQPDGSIFVPHIRELSGLAAALRCMTPLRLSGRDFKSIRKICLWSYEDLAKKMDNKCSSDTIQQWENRQQLMGIWAEKILRLHVCEHLRDRAEAFLPLANRVILNMDILDPFHTNSTPRMEFSLVNGSWYAEVPDITSLTLEPV